MVRPLFQAEAVGQVHPPFRNPLDAEAAREKIS